MARVTFLVGEGRCGDWEGRGGVWWGGGCTVGGYNPYT